MRVIDFRVRVPFRLTEDEPEVETPAFMDRYNRLLHYRDAVNTVAFPKLIEDMDAAGVEVAVLQAEYEFPFRLSYRELNDRCAEIVAKYPGRFVGFGTVDPRDGMAAVREVERAVRDLGLKGINLQPCFLGLLPTEAIFYPIYAKCAELGVPITFHSGVNYSIRHSIKFDDPIYLDEVACDFPELVIVASHGGWPWADKMCAIARKHPNVYVEFGAVSPKYIVHDRAGWDPMFQYMNSLLQDQVLFATDWPMMEFARPIKEFMESSLKEHVKEKVLGLNAARLLGI